MTDGDVARDVRRPSRASSLVRRSQSNRLTVGTRCAPRAPSPDGRITDSDARTLRRIVEIPGSRAPGSTGRAREEILAKVVHELIRYKYQN